MYYMHTILKHKSKYESRLYLMKSRSTKHIRKPAKSTASSPGISGGRAQATNLNVLYLSDNYIRLLSFAVIKRTAFLKLVPFGFQKSRVWRRRMTKNHGEN